MTLPATMAAVLLTGHGGLDKLEYRTDVPVPQPGAGEALIQVGAAGINNTDINTRTAWYSKAVGTATESGGAGGFAEADAADGGWDGPLQFPRIQGADVCGRIVAVGAGVDQSRIGERVLVRSMMRGYSNSRPFACQTLGSECDGGFAQFAKAPAADTWAVNCDWSDAELASIPCAYSTAENLLHRAAVGAETVLITGASGGVGSAAVQLARRRGATVIAQAAAAKFDEVRALGASKLVERGADLVAELGVESVDVVIDLVAGPGWPQHLEILRKGGRYAVAGAIAGPLVELDVRTLYLKDLSLFGCTFQEDIVFENLIRTIERGDLRPLVARTYPLADIAAAQSDFLAKKHTGKLVLVPPAVGAQ
ncbi:MAG: alcohol dehydrogenase family protein [Gammaproteobacteria bacterium]|nr:alcohol dehydrogenase family protein [Gammaproteobacteria bacterium]